MTIFLVLVEHPSDNPDRDYEAAIIDSAWSTRSLANKRTESVYTKPGSPCRYSSRVTVKAMEVNA